MENKIKNIIITIGFIGILMLTFVINLITKDKDISTTERRKLQQLPEITFNTVINKSAMDKFEKYTTDQFLARDTFRGIKSFFNINIYNQKDNNKLFVKDNGIYKMEYPLNETNVNKSLGKIADVYNKYLKGMNVYYAIIPDKNYYLENDDHLKMDYIKLKTLANNKLGHIKYIDIWSDLTLEDYYRTDLHWKQENLNKVVATIEKNMNLESTSNGVYTKINLGDFYGTYYGQLATNLKPDTLHVLSNDIILNSTTYNYETGKQSTVYTETNSTDRYDIFLSGATPLIRIDNTSAKTDKELLLFRDSFGSSLAPLLVQNYSKITLIDLRYISSSLLEQYINFESQDVLFIYSTLILNENVLK